MVMIVSVLQICPQIKIETKKKKISEQFKVRLK